MAEGQPRIQCVTSLIRKIKDRLHLNNFKIKMINYSGDSSHRFLPHESKQFSSGVTLNKINQGCRTNDTNVHLAAAKVVCSPPSFISNVVKHDKK